MIPAGGCYVLFCEALVTADLHHEGYLWLLLAHGIFPRHVAYCQSVVR